MALKLTILSEQRTPLGARSSIVFGVGGGSIGRAHDNDWVLPDPERYLSAHHARVKFHNGAFYLLDTSTNGVFINERSEALGAAPAIRCATGIDCIWGNIRSPSASMATRLKRPRRARFFRSIPRRRWVSPPRTATISAPTSTWAICCVRTQQRAAVSGRWTALANRC